MSGAWTGRSSFTALLPLWLVACSGCPATNATHDTAVTDAYTSPVVDGIANEAQPCELTRSELRLVCEAELAELDLPGPRERACTDGTTQLFYESIEQCVAGVWDYCESSGVCLPPVAAVVRCNRAIVQRCVCGNETDDFRVQCSVSASPDCTVDRSQAYRP